MKREQSHYRVQRKFSDVRHGGKISQSLGQKVRLCHPDTMEPLQAEKAQSPASVSALFFLAFLVGLVLARGSPVYGASLRFVEVARKHGTQDVASDAHNDLVGRLREFTDKRVTIVVPAPDNLRLVRHHSPRRL